jgi:hypothetical protein
MMWGMMTRWGALSLFWNNRQKSISEGAATTVLCALYPEVKSGGYYYDCKSSEGERLHPMALDDTLSKKLWELSEKVIGDKA